MTALLELREKVKQIYYKTEVAIIPLLKFLIAFIALKMINSHLGYSGRITSTAIVLIVALMCSFLPTGAIAVVCSLFCLLHLYSLSIVALGVGLIFFLIVYLLYLRFAPKDSVVVVLTPIFCVLHIPYVIPVAMGLIGSPSAVVSVGCGLLVYYFLHVMVGTAPTINTMGSKEMLAQVKLLVDNLLGNREVVVFILAFSITIIVVYLLRRMAIPHCWSIAMVAGAVIDMIVLLIGDMKFNVGIGIGGMLFGAILAIAAGKLIEFFRFLVDWGRVERVQFEDDEYYYYVKAVPKISLGPSKRTVKRINRSAAVYESEYEPIEEYYEDDGYYGDEEYEDNPDDFEELF